ncbi:MAG TPA: hypothetical protein VF916_00295 [Ktedonobacterales bacterium]
MDGWRHPLGHRWFGTEHHATDVHGDTRADIGQPDEVALAGEVEKGITRTLDHIMSATPGRVRLLRRLLWGNDRAQGIVPCLQRVTALSVSKVQRYADGA